MALRPNVQRYAWPTRHEGFGEGSQHVLITPTGDGATLRAMINRVLTTGTDESMTLGMIALAEHDMEEDTLRQRAQRVCSFTVPFNGEPHSLWQSPLLSELCLAAPFGLVSS